MPGKNSKQSTKAVTETPVEPVVAAASDNDLFNKNSVLC
jgi:hypothetical protein